ncbi:MAG: helicase-related protein, partial [Pseudomonadota bacterium]
VVKDLYLNASLEEEAAYQALLDVPFTYRGEHSPERNGQLVRIGLQKSLFSSPAAARVSVEQRIKKLSHKTETSDDEHHEIQALHSLLLALRNVDAAHFRKYQELLTLLKSSDFGWKKTNTEDRLVIFSERIETLNWLEGQLMGDLKLKEDAVQILHGGMSDIEQQEIVEAFGKPESKLRVLLCSDVASEGINLHYLSHRLVHFDLPWSLMVFQQRNGRVDRYGQTEEPIITYLINRSDNPTVKGDQRILEILKEKDEQAYKNIGDPATFMKVHDADAEAALTADAMATGTRAEAFDAKYQPDDSNEGDDLLALFLKPPALNPEAGVSSSQGLSKEEEGEPPTVERYSLFESDYDFARQALEAINRERKQVSFTANNERQTLTLTPPDDLAYRFRFLPLEISPENGSLVLTADKARFEDEIRRSRQDENAWPKLHYLWPQHPAIQWLEDKLLAQVARHSAPVLALPDMPQVNAALQPGEAVFLVSGLIPNRKAHPVVWQWFAIRCQDNRVTDVQNAEAWLKQLQLGSKLPNRAQPLAISALEALRQPVIDAAQRQMAQHQADFTAATLPELDRQLAELKALQQRQVNQLERQLDRSSQAEHFKASRREERLSRIEKVFDDYRAWVQDTLTIEPVPFIQIIAVLTRETD